MNKGDGESVGRDLLSWIRLAETKEESGCMCVEERLSVSISCLTPQVSPAISLEGCV